MKKRIIGVKNIFYGDTLETGLMPDIGAMTEIGELLIDSVNITKEDDTKTDIKNQETAQVDSSILSEIGAEIVNFATRNQRISNLILAFGGSSVGGKWLQPVNAFRGREVSIKIITRETDGSHGILDFPKVKLTAKNQAELTETENATILYSCSMLTPKNESTGIDQAPKYVYFQPSSPEIGVVDNVAKTFEFTPVTGFDTATEYEYSDDGGNTFVDCTTFMIDVSSSGAIAIGDLLVRVKEILTGDADLQHVAGFALANDEAFAE